MSDSISSAEKTNVPDMESRVVERQPFTPFLPPNAKVLMLGSFPPQPKRWAMDFFYPNYTNDMWRIMGHIFKHDADCFVDKANKCYREEALRQFLEETGIALFDTAMAVIRTTGTASDKDLVIVEPTDLSLLLSQVPQCKAVVATGQKAAENICAAYQCEMPAIGSFTPIQIAGKMLRFYRMPSTSRAYPLKMERKAEPYARMMREIGLLG